MGDLNYVTDDSRDDVGYSDDELNSYFHMSDEERATDVSDTTDGSDAYVCEVWDEPNHISADHGYYPDLLEWQSDVDPPSDGEEGSDESSTTTLEQHLCNLGSLDREEAEVRMTTTRVRCIMLCNGLGDDSDDSDE
jgi:hypothetical protein